MIGMPAVLRGRNHDRRSQPTNHAGEKPARLGRIDDARVRQLEILSHGEAKDCRRPLRLFGPQGGRSARAHLTFGEIQYARATALRRELDERTAARELGVISVREDRENVQIGHAGS